MFLRNDMGDLINQYINSHKLSPTDIPNYTDGDNICFYKNSFFEMKNRQYFCAMFKNEEEFLKTFLIVQVPGVETYYYEKVEDSRLNYVLSLYGIQNAQRNNSSQIKAINKFNHSVEEHQQELLDNISLLNSSISELNNTIKEQSDELKKSTENMSATTSSINAKLNIFMALIVLGILMAILSPCLNTR